MLTITVHDEHGYSATAQQRTATQWDVRYYRDGEQESEGWISTPPPHMPPIASIMRTLETVRQEAEYWAARATC